MLHPMSSSALRIAFAALFAWACASSSQRADTADPDDEAAQLAPKDSIERSSQLIAQGKAREALDLLDGELAKRPNDPELHYARGVAQRHMGKNDDALAAWNRTVELDPRFAAAMNGIAAIHLEAGRLDDGIAMLERAVKAKPEFADAHFNLALALAQKGQLDDAISSLTTASQLAPKDPAPLVELSALYTKQRKMEQAKAAAKQAVELDPKSALARMSYGVQLSAAGDQQGAIRELEAAIAISPELHEAKLALARALLRADRPVDASKHLESLTNVLSNNAAMWSDLGAALAKQGKFDGAIAQFDRALALDPELASAHVRKIGALAESKRCKEAKAALTTFRHKKPNAEALDAASSAAQSCK